MSPELITAALKMIGVLVLIIGALLVFNTYSRRFLKAGIGGSSRKRLQVLESTPLGLKKSLTLVKVPGAVLVLGVTQDRITLLDRMDGEDFPEAAETLSSAPSFPSFHDQLRKVTGVFQRKDARLEVLAVKEAKPC